MKGEAELKYEYRSVTWKYEVEVDERFNEILLELDRKDDNADRKHSRRLPISLEGADYEGEWTGSFGKARCSGQNGTLCTTRAVPPTATKR